MKFYLRAAEEFIPAQPVLYMRRTGAYGSENRVLMERLKAWLSARGLLGPDAVIAAVPLDDPARTKAAQCRYDVCAVCAPGQAAPADPVRVRTLDGGRYVVFLLDHTAEAIQRGWAFPLTPQDPLWSGTQRRWWTGSSASCAFPFYKAVRRKSDHRS